MRRAFTLIELLVVIAIITLLLAIAAPTSRRVLQAVPVIGCANNMRQLMQATLHYAADNGRYLPGPNWGGGTNSSFANTKGWLYRNNQMDQLVDLEGGLLWPYINKHDVYRCPADDTDLSTVPERPYNSRAITSYCTNGSACGYGGRTHDQNTGYWNTYKVNDFLEASSDVLMWEPDETKAGGWWWDGSNYPWEGITGRHIDEGMVGCIDGHAEWLDVDTYYELSPKSPTKRTRLWNRPGSSTGK